MNKCSYLHIIEYFELIFLGSVPNTFCQLSSLKDLYLTYSSTNPGITCAPLCVSSITSANLYIPPSICVYPQDQGLCGMIAATNIQSISGYSRWSCSVIGYTSSTPCLSPVWPGISCIGIDVIAITISNLGLTGDAIYL